MNLDDALRAIVREEARDGVREALQPHLPKLTRPDVGAYNLVQAGQVLGVSGSHVGKLVADGKLPRVPYTTGRVLVPRVAVEALVVGADPFDALAAQRRRLLGEEAD